MLLRELLYEGIVWLALSGFMVVATVTFVVVAIRKRCWLYLLFLVVTVWFVGLFGYMGVNSLIAYREPTLRTDRGIYLGEVSRRKGADEYRFMTGDGQLLTMEYSSVLDEQAAEGLLTGRLYTIRYVDWADKLISVELFQEADAGQLMDTASDRP